MELFSMDNAKSFVGGVTGSAVSFLSLSLEDADHLIGIICGIVGLLITIATTVVLPLLRRIKKAKEDGKVTLDEVIDIVQDTANNVSNIKENINKIDTDDKK